MGYLLGGLYIITDKKLILRSNFIETVEKALRGGAKIIQLREKATPEKEIIKLGKELLEVTRKYSVPLIINDSPVLAKEIGVDGVHIGQYDMLIPEAREFLGNKTIIGVSCYGDIQRGLQAEREGADYVSFGTPFFTPTKPDRKPTPFEVLREAKRRITKIPVFAIGGITKENARSVLETGVDGICVITSVFSSSDPEKASRELALLFET
ncbi:MAG TPA: thiamine phosphate synthase [Thermodesulfobacteriota bacterium]|nr:thiamine phosphate synthase [Thermodesulfobacteriota bacterium]